MGAHLEEKLSLRSMFSAARILKVAERQMMILLLGAGGAAGSLVELQGCEPRTLCQLAQQPWQEVSLQTWWSHSNTKHAHPPPPSVQHTYTLCLSLQRILKDDSHDLRCITELTTGKAAVSSFCTQCHLRQKNWTGSDLSGRDECSSCSHLHRDNSVQMYSVTEIYSTTVLQVYGGIFTTLLGFINFSRSTSSRSRTESRLHQKYLSVNRL